MQGVTSSWAQPPGAPPVPLPLPQRGLHVPVHEPLPTALSDGKPRGEKEKKQNLHRPSDGGE